MSASIAKAAPFAGAPVILTPFLLGATVNKPFLYRIPAIGERPLTFSASGLPEGLALNGQILTGILPEKGEWRVEITVSNAQGTAKKTIRLTCDADNSLRTPLLGFTTWNAFAQAVTQEDMERTAQQLIDTGLADYGYAYVNLDSGWQKEYGGEFDAIQPNEKFPDMKAMYDFIHSLGLRGGIYSTPMRTAWGCPDELPSIPGCTRGEQDPLRTNCMGGVCLEHMEKNNVRQWEAWGVDYLKYDWNLCDPLTADEMKQALLAASRDIPLCVTTNAHECYGHYWTKNCCSWRKNPDSFDNWPRFSLIIPTVDAPWKKYVRPGHFFDLDMLEIGHMYWNKGNRGLTEDEYLFCYSLRAFFASPIQLSCRLEALTGFERDMIMNEEIIAINQDALADFPDEIRKDESVRIYKRTLENGDIAYALFNMKEEARVEAIDLPENTAVRDVWMKENIPAASNLACKLPPHGVRIFRVTPAN